MKFMMNLSLPTETVKEFLDASLEKLMGHVVTEFTKFICYCRSLSPRCDELLSLCLTLEGREKENLIYLMKDF